MKTRLNSILQQAIAILLSLFNACIALVNRSNKQTNQIQHFASGIALSFTAAMMLLCVGPTPAAQAQAAAPATLTPRQVVEYALTLEKLEADFYRRAIVATQSGGLSGVPPAVKDAIISYGQDEAQHVTDLSAVLSSLGGDPNAIAIPTNPNYLAIIGRDPFANVPDFLLVGQYVEDLGVAAYKGQVQDLLAAGEAGKTVLAAALEIHSVEARHAAGIRFLRQALLGANVRPWISTDASSTQLASVAEVIYNENRMGSPIPFSSDAFDGYATYAEVLALVGPVLEEAAPMPSTPMPTPSQPTPQTNQPTGNTAPRALW